MNDSIDGKKVSILKDVPATATSETPIKIIKPNSEELKPGEIFYMTIKA